MILQNSLLPLMKEKTFDLEERTFQFAKDVRSFGKSVPLTHINIEDSKQIIRSSGSIGANYIESRESLGKKDSLMRLRISRKEAKECAYFSRLMETSSDSEIRVEAGMLRKEAIEIKNILSSIILKKS